MASDFLFWLSLIVILTGAITLIDWLIFSKKRREQQVKASWVVEYSRAFFPVLLAVLLIRSFVVQGFRVPTGSLMPTVLPGDLIAVKQYSYGLRLPVLHTKIMDIGSPQRGDIVVFRLPPDPSQTYVKRVIGVPGDLVEYRNKVLYINGEEMPQKNEGKVTEVEGGRFVLVQRKLEKLDGKEHYIYVRPNQYSSDFKHRVPEGYYFMMGDNRDNSLDSREWGFVPDANLIGQAFGIWMSWDPDKKRIRFSRIGISL